MALDLRRTHVAVTDDKREHPRLDFKCSAVIKGIPGVVLVTDISLGGFFCEYKKPGAIQLGQVTEAKVYLPTEHHPLQVKVQLVNRTPRGIGCKYVDLSSEQTSAVHFAFESYRDMLPIG